MSNYLPEKEIVCKVRCSNAMHRIVLSPSGNLSFPDHSKRFRTERVLMDLAGKKYETCRCYEFLLSWRKGRKENYKKIPKELREIRQQLLILSLTRRRKRRFWNPYSIPVSEKIKRNILQTLYAASRQVPYLKYRNIVFNVFTKKETPLQAIQHATRGRSSIYICIDWYKTVYRRKLAVIDEKFISSAGESQADGSIPVKVISPNRKSQLVETLALAIPDKTKKNSFTLSSLGN